MKACLIIPMGLLALLAMTNNAYPASAQPVTLPAEATVPPWPKPTQVPLPSNSPQIKSDKLRLIHSRDILGGFEVRVDGKSTAIGQNHPMIGYLQDGHLRWLDLSESGKKKVEAK